VNTARIEELIDQVRALPDPLSRSLALALVQAVMDFHAEALERIMALASEADSSGAVISALASDDLAGGMLLLHDLHPLDLEARVRRALDQPALHARGAAVNLISVEDGNVRVHVEGGPALRNTVEKALAAAAPDAAGILIEGAEGMPAANFVPLEQLLAT